MSEIKVVQALIEAFFSSRIGLAPPFLNISGAFDHPLPYTFFKFAVNIYFSLFQKILTRHRDRQRTKKATSHLGLMTAKRSIDVYSLPGKSII